MAKFLYLQDFHIKGKNPENRKDNYYQSMLNKLDEIIKLSKKYKVDYVIDGGDFFDSALITNTIIDDILDRIEKANIPWYMLYGNHCLIGHNIENSKSSSLAHMIRRSKLVNHLKTIEDKNTYIEGYEYYHNIEQDIKERGLYAVTDKDKKIAIIHALLTEISLPQQAQHVKIDNIKTDYSLILVAHNHNGEGIIEKNGTKFINLGCIGRTGIDEIDVVPSVLYIDTNKDKIEIIKLKNVKSKEETFDLSKVEEKKKFIGEIDNFIRSLENVKIRGMNLKDTIVYIAKEKEIDKEIVDTVIERIGQME